MHYLMPNFIYCSIHDSEKYRETNTRHPQIVLKM